MPSPLAEAAATTCCTPPREAGTWVGIRVRRNHAEWHRPVPSTIERTSVSRTASKLQQSGYFAFLTGSFLEGLSFFVEDSAALVEDSTAGLGLSSDLLEVLPDFA